MYVCNERENVNLVVKEVLYMYAFVHRGGFHSIYDMYMCLPSSEYRRGPHTFWLKKAERGETIDTNSDGLVNMLHYEDAAAATIAAVLAGRHQYCYLSLLISLLCMYVCPFVCIDV